MTQKSSNYRFAAKILGELTFMISVPAVISAIIGKVLDQKFEKTLFFLPLCLVLSFLFTLFLLRKKIPEYQKEYLEILNEK